MGKQDQYRVKPDTDVSVVTKDYIKRRQEVIKDRGLFRAIYWATLAPVTIGLILFIPRVVRVMYRPNGETSLSTDLLILLGLLAFSLGMALVLTGMLISSITRNLVLKEIRTEKLGQYERKAKADTSKALSVLDEASNAEKQLPKCIEYASEWLEQAKNEYKENAFGPFWDKVEGSALNLAAFYSSVEQISENAQVYYGTLKGRKHTFPHFSPRPESLPDPSSVVENFNSIVRKGQTNFQFASIWEHRKTREVLIAGFKTLGQAVNNLGAAVTSSLSNLESSISSLESSFSYEAGMIRDTIADQVGEIAREQEKTRETFAELKK